MTDELGFSGRWCFCGCLSSSLRIRTVGAAIAGWRETVEIEDGETVPQIAELQPIIIHHSFPPKVATSQPSLSSEVILCFYFANMEPYLHGDIFKETKLCGAPCQRSWIVNLFFFPLSFSFNLKAWEMQMIRHIFLKNLNKKNYITKKNRPKK